MKSLVATWLFAVTLAPSLIAQVPRDSVDPLAAPSMVLPGAAGASLDRAEDERIAELERDLTDRDEKTRRAAVNKLVDIGSTKAWLVVVEALANDKARPADEAQIDLADVTDEKVLKVLFGKGGLKHSDQLVRTRVAELMGRRKAVEAELMGKALKERDPEVRRLLLWSIERLALAGELTGDLERELQKELVKLMRKDSDGAVRGAALFAHEAVFGAEATTKWVVELADAKPEGARAAAALLAGGEAGGEGGSELLAALLVDESSIVRKAAIRGLEQRARAGELEALSQLIARLEAEERPRLQWALVDALQRASGMQYRLDTRPWRRWFDGLGDDWVPGSEEREVDRGEATVAFAGLPLLSDRVAFLIDFSGSIWNEKDGKLPKDQVGAELTRVLDRLTEETWFNVVPFINDPVPWSEELVQAKKKNLAAAKEFYADCKAYGAGNVYDAIQLVLEDPMVDTIVVLSDGAPSGGTRWNLNLMIPALLEQNRYRQVAFDSLLVGAPGGLVRHWEALSEGSGGECISTELK
ncbi:MAG: hypothetical protein P1V81_14130 [Planctomycetota bacterium]|nr:hypothetical protein [Planctomycetota bacterium]